MKRTLLLFLLVISRCTLAQVDSIAFIKQKLAEASDSNKFILLLTLGDRFQFIKRDSALKYYRQAEKFKRKNDLVKDELRIAVRISRHFFEQGDNVEALRLSLGVIEMATSLHDTLSLFGAFRQMYWIHRELGEFTSALPYSSNLVQLTRSKAVTNAPNSSGLCAIAYRIKGENFQFIHEYDSAYFNFLRALQFSRQTPNGLPMLLTSGALGIYFMETAAYDSAMYYLRINGRLAATLARKDIEGESFHAVAQVFAKQNKLDSAFAYASKALKWAKDLPDSVLIAASMHTMSNLYEMRHRIDSAYKYLKLAAKIDSRLREHTMVNKVKDMILTETLRKEQRKQEQKRTEQEYASNLKIYSLVAVLIVAVLIGTILFRSSKRQQRDALKIRESYEHLRTIQAQLVQSEKMAALGELTAGIAHEIQNPLNFINNFSEVNKELIAEMNEELAKGSFSEAKEIASNVTENLEKINHHGKRADAIVKSMLQHSRKSSGQKEPTDINALCDEYLRLAYHGLRAKDKSFNAKFETDFDQSLPPITAAPQEIGRVILNLINNAFYATNEKIKLPSPTSAFQPLVTVSTKNLGDKVQISVKDNGIGVPEKIKEKIFQPFFTTKPTGQGTGLGLSLSFDIIKAHRGILSIESSDESGTVMNVIIPHNS